MTTGLAVAPMIAVFVAVTSLALVCAEAVLSYLAGMFSPAQMRRSYPDHEKGLPFRWHLGMWGDVVVMTPLLAWMSSQLPHAIGPWILAVAVTSGFAASAALHWYYCLTPTPDSLAWKGGLSPAGGVHLVYTALALALVGLIFFGTPKSDAGVVIVSASALAFQVLLASKPLMGIVNRYVLHFPWCPAPDNAWSEWLLSVLAPWLVIAAVAALAVLR